MAARREMDLAEVRRNLVRLAGVQALLLAVVLVFVALNRGASTAPLTLWLGVLPLLVALWGLLYWRSLKRAEADGGDSRRYLAANKASLRTLGLFVGLWAIGLVAVLLLV